MTAGPAPAVIRSGAESEFLLGHYCTHADTPAGALYSLRRQLFHRAGCNFQPNRFVGNQYCNLVHPLTYPAGAYAFADSFPHQPAHPIGHHGSHRYTSADRITHPSAADPTAGSAGVPYYGDHLYLSVSGFSAPGILLPIPDAYLAPRLGGI